MTQQKDIPYFLLQILLNRLTLIKLFSSLWDGFWRHWVEKHQPENCWLLVSRYRTPPALLLRFFPGRFYCRFKWKHHSSGLCHDWSKYFMRHSFIHSEGPWCTSAQFAAAVMEARLKSREEEHFGTGSHTLTHTHAVLLLRHMAFLTSQLITSGLFCWPEIYLALHTHMMWLRA